MKDFLFAPQQARTPLSALSGGERGRLMLARALAKPSNLLVLDEPTNDLDLETLDVLEEMLADYAGTVILISHDRDFLDRAVNARAACRRATAAGSSTPAASTDMLAARRRPRGQPDARRSRKTPARRRRLASARGADGQSAASASTRSTRSKPLPRADRRACRASLRRLQDAAGRSAGFYARDRQAFTASHRGAGATTQSQLCHGRGTLARSSEMLREEIEGRVACVREWGQPCSPCWRGYLRQTTRLFLSGKRGARGRPSIGAWGGSPTRASDFTFPRR